MAPSLDQLVSRVPHAISSARGQSEIPRVAVWLCLWSTVCVCVSVDLDTPSIDLVFSNLIDSSRHCEKKTKV
ncbi:hypothetical protein Hamer_G011983 [Homarus americanus]|uniref:Uncharacterized protein n=1 Tax=Homarus americanus TaxID=6706 RepID=A0A8J5K310_HOMAM|nr:hypothetical protein Hamer_G011983 [Homarus americanus]